VTSDPQRDLLTLLDLASYTELVVNGVDDLADSSMGIDFGATRLGREERAVETFVAGSEEVRCSVLLCDA
jgi:hypothetical protein